MLLFSLNLLVKFLDVSIRRQYFLSCERPFASFFFFSSRGIGVSLPPSCSVHLRLHHTDCALPSLLPPCFPPWPASSFFLHLITFPHGICPSITLCVGISTGCVGNMCWCLLVIVILSRVWLILHLLYSYSFSTHRRGPGGRAGGRGVVKFSLHAFYLSRLQHQ